MKRFLDSSVLRDFVLGAAGPFDIFGQQAPIVKLGTLEDDVARVGDDFRAIERDFASILSRRGSAGPND